MPAFRNVRATASMFLYLTRRSTRTGRRNSRKWQGSSRYNPPCLPSHTRGSLRNSVESLAMSCSSLARVMSTEASSTPPRSTWSCASLRISCRTCHASQWSSSAGLLPCPRMRARRSATMTRVRNGGITGAVRCGCSCGPPPMVDSTQPAGSAIWMMCSCTN